MKTRNDIELSTGNIVTHTRMKNGATMAELTCGREMTSDEWNEYCGILRDEQIKAIREAKQLRIARNHAAFNADNERSK